MAEIKYCPEKFKELLLNTVRKKPEYVIGLCNRIDVMHANQPLDGDEFNEFLTVAAALVYIHHITADE